MYNPWGGSLSIFKENEEQEGGNGVQGRSVHFGDRPQPGYTNLLCLICTKKLLLFLFLFLALTLGFVEALTNVFHRNSVHPMPLDDYALVLHKALLFFHAQKSGRLPPSNNISYRGDSGLEDGAGNSAPVDLVGGFYDGGSNVKFHFPAAFSMTLLSWSVIDYGAKYQALGLLDEAKNSIKWGVDYLLKTINSSASEIHQIYAQVGIGYDNYAPKHGGISCWERPEHMSSPRHVTAVQKASDLAAEMAAALASASIVFKDNYTYSSNLLHASQLCFNMARRQRGIYSHQAPDASRFYNSSGYWDELIWGSTWLFYATGEKEYLQLATSNGLADHAFKENAFGVFNWNYKLLGAQVLLARLRLLMSPGYPYETLLRRFQEDVEHVMCSFLSKDNKSPGGMINFNLQPSSLQLVTNAAFLAVVYAEQLKVANVPGWRCGSTFNLVQSLEEFARFQLQYILGHNPLNMSYVVGHGKHFPRQVHHRAASIPYGYSKVSCLEGYLKWMGNPKTNPNVLVGAMVNGPNELDSFQDIRSNPNFTEPTLTGNVGLVVALVSVTHTSTFVDMHAIFSSIQPTNINSYI